jgi:hypothetical protein
MAALPTIVALHATTGIGESTTTTPRLLLHTDQSGGTALPALVAGSLSSLL